MEQMLRLGLSYPHLFAIRFPRGSVSRVYPDFCGPLQQFKIGQAEVIREGSDATLLALGSMVESALQVHDLLKIQGTNVRVVNMRFAKPLDSQIIFESLSKNRFLFTLEEHVATGGFGSKVLEFLEQQKISDVSVHRFALPDQFVEQGNRDILFDHLGLSPEKMAAKILSQIRSKDPLFTPVS